MPFQQIGYPRRITLLPFHSVVRVPAFALFAILTIAPTAMAQVVTSLANDGPGSLRDLMESAPSGAIITFDPALAGQTILLSEQITSSQTIEVDATGLAPDSITLDAQGLDRIFHSFGGLTLRGLTMKNGMAADGEGGGAVYSQYSALTIEDCLIESCSGGRYPEGEFSGSGGGVLMLGGALEVKDSTIRSCSTLEATSVSGAGGGIAAITDLTVTIERSKILNCSTGIGTTNSPGSTAGSGGGISVIDGAVCTISDCMIVSNWTGNGDYEAGSGGGVFYAGGDSLDADLDDIGELHIERSLIAFNRTGHGTGTMTSGAPGGGLSTVAGRVVTVTDSTFRGNSTDSAVLPVPNNSFERAGAHGGAIHLQKTAVTGYSSPLEIRSSTFVGNHTGGFMRLGQTGGKGGAIYGEVEIMTVFSSTFHANFTGTGPAGEGAGGAVYFVHDTRNPAFDHCTVVGNTGDSAIVGVNSSNGVDRVHIRNSIVADNAGGDISTGILSGFAVNMISTREGPDFISSVGLIVDSPQLEPLGNWGGPTQTMPPTPGSNVLDLAPLFRDVEQRGFARVLDGDCDGTALVDLGAVELACRPYLPPTQPLPSPSFNFCAMDGGNLTLRWGGGPWPYLLETTSTLDDSNSWTQMGMVSGRVAVVATPEPYSVYRLRDGPSQTARYRWTFTSTWDAINFPDAFPNFAHFSQLVGVTHTSLTNFWTLGGFASPAFEALAEDGATAPLNQEIDSARTAGTAGPGFSAPLLVAPGTIQREFDASLDFPLLTFASMIGPSPDWFVGVSGIGLSQNGRWIDDVTIPVYAHDAGTETGDDFVMNNPAESPHRRISRPVDTPLGTTPLGTFRLQRID